MTIPYIGMTFYGNSCCLFELFVLFCPIGYLRVFYDVFFISPHGDMYALFKFITYFYLPLCKSSFDIKESNSFDTLCG